MNRFHGICRAILPVALAMTLAHGDTQVIEAPDLPQWLVDLFPYDGDPDECEHRLKRLSAEEVTVGDLTVGQVTCELLYRDILGQTQTGKARFFLPKTLGEESGARAPLMCNAGYEVDAAGASAFVREGMVVSTQHADPRNPLDRGPNLDTAVLHAARALPFVDNSKVAIQGGSAGGYMTLMLAAESFPLTCAAPLVPPVDVGYNAAYFVHNRDTATAVPEGSDQPTLLVLTVVIPIADAASMLLGNDMGTDSWRCSSPIAHVDTIAAPTQVVWSTADILVPIDQVSRDLVRAREPGLLPEAFTTDPADIMARPEEHATLVDALPEEAYELIVVPLPEDAPVLHFEQTPEKPFVVIDVPFSRERTWSLVVIDEGPVEPDVGHFRHALMPDQEPFRRWAMERGAQPEQLTPEKLRRLMMRLLGQEYRPFTIQPEGTEQPTPAVRLDFPEAERADVLAGLRAFAQEDACAERLAAAYGDLPEELKALGEALGDGTPDSVRKALQEAR